MPKIPTPILEALETSALEPEQILDINHGLHKSKQRDSFLDVINFLSDLSERELMEKKWTQGLEKWYAIFSCGREAWPLGFNLDSCIASHDVTQLRDIFGSRSASTVYKRGCDLVRFMTWFRENRFSFSPFPLSPIDVEEYIIHLRESKSSPSALRSFSEAVVFAQHVEQEGCRSSSCMLCVVLIFIYHNTCENQRI